jgi:hypothetical protein
MADDRLGSALARLEARWGHAAVRLGTPPIGGERPLGIAAGRPLGVAVDRPLGMAADRLLVHGALALASQPAEAAADPARVPTPLSPLGDEILSTGFPHLDTLLGVGGLPRGVTASLRGARSSGKTALALQLVAQAQAHGAIAAFLDPARIFDPLDAAGRGVDLRWLLILRPQDAAEGFALAGALLSGRHVDLLVVDLPDRLPARHEAPLRRLAAHTRRTQVRFVVLEPASVSTGIHGALAEVCGLRLELEQRAWLRLGRDVVGRRVAVTVAKNRFGPPGRRTELEIRYLHDGEHAPAVDRFATPLAGPSAAIA